MVRDGVAYAVALHFDSNVGMSYWDDLGRRKRTVGRPEWWKERESLVLDWVLPSLKAQDMQDFETWAFLDPRDAERNAALRRALYHHGIEATYEGPRALREAYRERCHWLCILHTDSDDMACRAALSDLLTVRPEPGLTAWWNKGFMYGIHDGRMKEMETFPPVGPAPFYAQWYPVDVLGSARAWAEYREMWRMSQRHQDLRKKCRNTIEFDKIGYCGTIHGENTSRAWDNVNTNKRLGDEIVNPKKKNRILDLFGVAQELRQC